MLKFKKLLAIICTLSIIASALVFSVSATENTQVAWDGSTDQDFAGAGTANSPYLIETEAELAGLVTLGKTATTGKYYKMTRDMDVSGHSWYISGTDNETNVFNGTFDGAGYVVSGINISTGDGGWGTGCGLFPAISNNAHIKSVGIKNMNTDRWGWQSSNGAIFGYANLDNVPYDSEAGDYSTKYPTIEYCYADESVNVKATFSGGIGGTVCGGGFLRISNCSFTGTFGGGYGQCAAIGNIYGSLAFVFNFYSTSSFSALETSNNNIKYFNSYTTSDGLGTVKTGTQLAAEQMTGENARANMTGFDFDIIWRTNENGYPSLRAFDEDAPSIWNGTSVDQVFDGEGTAESPYLIDSAAELAGLVTLGKTATTGNYYRMTRNMDVSAAYWYISENDLETNVFNGNFDGAGYLVSGIKYSTGNGGWGSGAGLFPGISNDAHIKNVGVINMDADLWSGDVSCGAIFGYAELNDVQYDDVDGDYSTTYPTVEYCYADSSVTKVKAPYNGGIGGTVCGSGFLRISNCYFTGTATGGYSNCASIGNVYGATAFIFNFYSTLKFGGKNSNIKYFNSYTTGDPTCYLQSGTQLSLENMTGANAAANMAGFDFNSVWQTVDGSTPTLRVFNRTTLAQEIISSSVSYDSDGNANGTKFVARASLPGADINDVTDGVITAKVNGVLKTVQGTGIIITRSGAEDCAFTDIKNDPLSGYKIAGYVKGNVNADKLALNESAVATASTVKGAQTYYAKSYVLFTDGTVVIGEKYTAEPTGTASSDGFTQNDVYTAGDANFDGDINILDLVRMKKYSAGDYNTAVIMDVIDLFKDSTFGSNDIAALKQTLLNGYSHETVTSEWSLAWSDEFDSQAVSSSNWTFSDKIGGASDMTTETVSSVQSVQKSENGDSFLHLTAYKWYDASEDENVVAGATDQYRTVKPLSTENSMTFKYGYVEMRAKMPAGTGAWPAFWLVSPSKTSAGYSTEVDVAEIMGAGDYQANLHKWYEDGTHDQNVKKYNPDNVNDGEWHNYGMLWDETGIKMYIDGNIYATYNLNSDFGTKGDGMNGFKEPLLLIISNHIITSGYSSTENGTWARGYEVAEDFTESVFDVDYVRLYQKTDGSSELNLLK